MLAIGTKVSILFPLIQPLRQGMTYTLLPHRQWPHHVWPDGKPGIAYSEAELLPVGETGEQQPWCLDYQASAHRH